MTINLLHITNINGNKQQACMIHAETLDPQIVLEAVKRAAGVHDWTIPPTWTTLEQGIETTRPNPRTNNRNMKIWHLVRNL